MLKVSASDFKAHCLHYMSIAHNKHEIVVITKHGKPIAQLVPYADELPPIFGRMQGTINIHGDIIQPMDDIEWDVLK